MANHKWRKKRGHRNTYRCSKCGIEKDVSSSHVFYTDKNGETLWIRPECICVERRKK